VEGVGRKRKTQKEVRFDTTEYTGGRRGAERKNIKRSTIRYYRVYWREEGGCPETKNTKKSTV